MTSTSGTSSNFGHLDYPNLGMGLSSGSTTGYSRDVIDLAEKLKYQHECIMHQQFSDEFYLQYAKNMLNMTQNSKFDKVLPGIDAVPDSDYAQYSYEEIITMSNNGVNIPTEVLAWAQAQREADVIDYSIVSDDVEYNDVNSQDKETGESEINKIRAEVKDNAIKSKKAQEDVEKDREKSRELTDTAISIAKKQKNILQNNSIDKIKDMADEWKSLDKKKQEEGKLDASEEAKYKKLSKNLKQGGAVIDELQKNSVDLDNFLESIDTLANDSNEGLITAQKTIDSSKNFSKLDDRLNIFHKVHAYKIAEKGSGLLEDALVNVNDTQLAYVAEKIGQDLLDIGNEGILDVTNENTQEAIQFSIDYTTKAKHIENTLGIENIENSEKISTQEEESKESEPETSSDSKEELTVSNAPEVSVEPQEETPVANAPEASVEPQEETPVANAPETSVEPQEETSILKTPETIVESQEAQDSENSSLSQFSPAMTRAASVSPSGEPQEEPTIANAPEATFELQEEPTVANASETSVEPQEEITNENPVQKPSETPTETEPIYVSENDTASNLTNAASSGRSPQDILNTSTTTRRATTNTSTSNNVEGSNKTGQSDKTEKTEQKEKEQIEDTQKTMKALYGTNVDFTKAFVGAEVAAAVGMGPASYIMQIAVWGGIVAASVLDLLVKNLIVGKSSEIAENEVKNSADFVKSLDTSSKTILAEHTKNMAEAKLISNEYKELNNQSIDYQFAMMQDQAKLVEAGKISAEDVIEYPDPFAGNKQNLEAKLQGLSDKDSQKINTINGPLKNSEKISKQSMKSNNDFSGLNDKLGERNSNNNQLGDFIIVDTAIAQGLITVIMAALAVMGFFSAPMLAAWAIALAKNAGLAATGVGAKLVSNQVDNRIDANNETFSEGQKSLMHDDKVKNDVRRVTAKAAADKMGNIPVQQEQQAVQNAQQNSNSENTPENENSQNNSSNNVTVPSPSVRKESDTRSGFDKSSLNSELDINNPNDVKKANEYAIAYTRDVNVYDEKSKAAASTNSNTSAADSNTTADIKLSRFNKDGAINSSKRSQKVNAASATHNGRKRR
ncbi:hypothetical protein J6O86_09110 [bacterium]|nr:hypothetical protein [bacterium]